MARLGYVSSHQDEQHLCVCASCSIWVQHLEGIQVGESRSFRITIPEDYPVDLWQVRGVT
jgi:hypothetical protein